VSQATTTPSGTTTTDERGAGRACHHVACSQLTSCAVAELQRMRANYNTGRAEHFRIKAADRAIRALQALRAPITTVQVGGAGRRAGRQAGRARAGACWAEPGAAASCVG
jgi:hypothetical protein